MNGVVTACCVQTRAHDRDELPRRLPELLSLLERAAGQAQLVVAPEGMVPAYFIGKEAIEPKLITQVEEAIGAIARRNRATIVYGTARLDETGKLFNSAVVLGPNGARLGHADKRFLWHFDRHWFTPGADVQPIDTPVGRLGILICADGRIPTLGATLVERGAQLLVMPTAWVSSGRNPQALENIQADLFIGVRAQENGVPLLAANKAGVEAHSIAYCGKSTIVARDGSFIARAGEREECIIVGNVEVSASRAAASSSPAISNLVCAQNVRPSARIALSPSQNPQEVEHLARCARLADADLLIARTTYEQPELPLLNVNAALREGLTLVESAGLRIGLASAQTLCLPRGLVPARLGGIDIFVWPGLEDEARTLAFARTRAMELRAFILTLNEQRASVCDPDGVLSCGTFEDYRMAAFTYERARCEASFVAPHTDVLAGLRRAEAMAAPVSA